MVQQGLDMVVINMSWKQTYQSPVGGWAGGLDFPYSRYAELCFPLFCFTSAGLLVVTCFSDVIMQLLRWPMTAGAFL